MKEFLVSIIVPIYNVEKYLNQCIDSIVNQTYENIEVILVDDGSTDKCPEICDDYATIDPRVQVVHKVNGGSASAREAGMKLATGVYMMFVDSDDWIELNTVEFCVQEIKKRENVECVMFSYMKESSNTSIPMSILDDTIYLEGREAEEKVYRRLFGLSNQELFHPERMENMTSCCMKLYKTNYAKKGKYYDIKTIGSCEDGLFNMYALHGCQHIVYLNMPLYHYRKMDGTQTSSFRPEFIKQWANLFFIMEEIIEEKKLGLEYKETLSNRIALSITAIGLNELRNPSHGMLGHIKTIKTYLQQERYRNAVKNIKVKNMPLPWKLLMISCKMQCATAVYAAIVAIERIRKR